MCANHPPEHPGEQLWEHPALERARALAVAGEFEQALATVRNTPELFDSALGQWWMGAILIGSDQESKAVPYLMRAAQLEPSCSSYVHDAAKWSNRAGRRSDAIALLRSATESEVCDPDLLLACAAVYADMGEQLLGAALLHRVVILSPPYFEHLRDAGDIFGRLGLHHEALDALQKACSLVPNHLGIWDEIGDAHRELAQIAEAELAYQNALQLVELELRRTPGSYGFQERRERITAKRAALRQR